MSMKRGEITVDINRPASFSLSSVGLHRISVSRLSETSQKSMRGYHYHDVYEMYYLHSGERYYLVSDKTYHVKAGTLVLIAPQVIHCTVASDSGPYERTLISFGREVLMPFLRILGEQENPLRLFERNVHTVTFEESARPLIEGLIGSMERAFSDRREGAARLCCIELLLLAAEAAETEGSESEEADLGATQHLVSEMRGYINRHYAEPLSLRSISEAFYLSPCYTSRIFRIYTGASFIEYLTAVRIMEARRRLASGSESITKIALAVGFRSTTHFGRVFKRITGMTPLTFRQQNLVENA